MSIGINLVMVQNLMLIERNYGKKVNLSTMKLVTLLVLMIFIRCLMKKEIK